MSEQKNQLSIEEEINEKLTDDTRENALDFVAFLQANEISIISSGEGEGWAIGGAEGNSIGFMLITGTPEFPGPWTFWFNSCDFGDDPADDELKETAWAHTGICGRCHAGWKDCGGGDRVIFGRKFENLCHSPLMFTNPDAKTLESEKKLVLMLNNTLSA